MSRPRAPLRQPVLHILLALASDDLHGLGIAEAVERASDGAVELGPGTLYRSLKEMLRQGVIQEVPTPEDADPRRRYYRATPLGKQLLSAEANRLARVVDLARKSGVLPEPQ